MKPDVRQAFDLLTQATGMLSGTRADHLKIEQALHVIEQELTPTPKEQK